MGTGNKFDPSAFVVTDISKTQGCPLARRLGLAQGGVEGGELPVQVALGDGVIVVEV